MKEARKIVQVGLRSPEANKKYRRLLELGVTNSNTRMGDLKKKGRKPRGCKRSGFKRNESESKKNRMVRVSPKELMPDSRLD